MARIRTIKPEFFRHEELQGLEAAHPGAHAMLVFAGLWGHCDKSGVFLFRPRMLKLDILPFLDFAMEQTLDLLIAAGFVERFELDGRLYGRIPTFADHQRITGKEAQEPARYAARFSGKQRGHNGETTETTGRERKGREKEEEGNRIYKPLLKTSRAREAVSEDGPRAISETVGQWLKGRGHELDA